MTVWLDVIGLDLGGIAALPVTLRAKIEAAELIVGGERHLAMLPPGLAGERQSWATPLKLTVKAILARRGRPVVVLATGDPMHFGIGVTLARAVAAGEMAVHPALSAFSLAASRLLWPLAESECLTIHGRDPEAILPALAPGRRLLLLAHDGASPARVARLLSEAGYGESRLIVLEEMGGGNERRREALARDWGERTVADLNTIAVECRADAGTEPRHRGFGLPDDAFRHDGQLTKREIRAAALSALAPLPGELLWDVGAGAGSIAIEWLRHHPSLRAIAVERDPARLALLRENALALGVPRLEIVAGAAPPALAGLPAPDAIFLGGGVTDSLGPAWEALPAGGRLVAHAVTAEAEAALLAAHARYGGEMSRLLVQRLSAVGERHGWKPLMPVTQFKARKPGARKP